MKKEGSLGRRKVHLKKKGLYPASQPGYSEPLASLDFE
jgi:hypothetical protein